MNRGDNTDIENDYNNNEPYDRYGHEDMHQYYDDRDRQYDDKYRDSGRDLDRVNWWDPDDVREHRLDYSGEDYQ